MGGIHLSSLRPSCPTLRLKCATRMSIETRDMLAEFTQIEIVIDDTQQMIFRNILVETAGNEILPFRCLSPIMATSAHFYNVLIP